ncbi:MAG: putative transporter ATP-binding protein [Symbiobacteriaceae bacterium]|jgi:peptide/nickel transport system ATP-binding protein|nr:putative transporter ATP-binding protein [Symbiobacteriaceae bacterium]
MAQNTANEPILRIRDLSVEFTLRQGTLRAVDHVHLDVLPGELLAIVGESGSGKSTLGYGLVNLVSSPGQIAGGQVIYKNQNVFDLSPEALRQFRWKEVAMVFQAAQNAMNPVMRIEDQMVDTVQDHENRPRAEILKRATELLKLVRLQPEQVLKAYPHELSGGMRQRVIMALSLLLNPRVLLLDEPTTALDVVTQAYLLDILLDIRAKFGITMVFMTHDISIVAKVADRVAVMYAGQIVETGDVNEIFYRPHHPYTQGLIQAAPSLVGDLSDKRPVPGSPPDLFHLPTGCRFHTRCSYATDICRSTQPTTTALDGHTVACHHWEQVLGSNTEGSR